MAKTLGGLEDSLLLVLPFFCARKHEKKVFAEAVNQHQCRREWRKNPLRRRFGVGVDKKKSKDGDGGARSVSTSSSSATPVEPRHEEATTRRENCRFSGEQHGKNLWLQTPPRKCFFFASSSARRRKKRKKTTRKTQCGSHDVVTHTNEGDRGGRKEKIFESRLKAKNLPPPRRGPHVFVRLPPSRLPPRSSAFEERRKLRRKKVRGEKRATKKKRGNVGREKEVREESFLFETKEKSVLPSRSAVFVREKLHTAMW